MDEQQHDPAVDASQPSPYSRPTPALPRHNLWLFVPLLYFMQAIPVLLIQAVSVVLFKDLGVANEEITRWVPLISLPWSLQMLLGPLVEFRSTKYDWIVKGQWLIAIIFVALPFIIQVPYAFQLSLVLMIVAGVTSALCNIAMDGYYMVLAGPEDQSKFVGVRTTFYRLGMLFCKSFLVFVAGVFMSFGGLKLQSSSGPGFMLAPKTTQAEATQTPVYRPEIEVVIKGGKFYEHNTDLPILFNAPPPKKGEEPPKDAKPYVEMEAPPGTYGLKFDGSQLLALTMRGDTPVGSLPIPAGSSQPAEVKPGLSPKVAWMFSLLIVAGVYLLGAFGCKVAVPKGGEATPGEATPMHAVGLVAVGVSGWLTLNALLRLTLHGIQSATHSEALAGWKLPDSNTILGFLKDWNPVHVELVQLGAALLALFASVMYIRVAVRGTEVAKAIGSFFSQDGIVPIFFFVLFYRFGEAMLTLNVPLFYKSVPKEGGLGVPNEMLGMIDGFAGVTGIILGGLIGGKYLSTRGVRQSFWLLAAAMYVPNFLYLWASLARPETGMLFVISFFDQFGYGFGFAGYFVYLMSVAQRGKYQTAHYAVATGLGAITIAVAGALGGVLQKNYGYPTLFVVVLLASIPGLWAMYSVPIDDSMSSLAKDAAHELE